MLGDRSFLIRVGVRYDGRDLVASNVYVPVKTFQRCACRLWLEGAAMWYCSVFGRSQFGVVNPLQGARPIPIFLKLGSSTSRNLSYQRQR
jgi:hypothetical protein